MEGEGDGTVQTEDGHMRMEGADGGSGPTYTISKEDGTAHGTEGNTTPSPEEGVQINDEESVASTETTLTTKADREVRELMKSVIDSSESIEDQSSFTQDGSEATEIHIPDLDISFDQSETGSVILGQNINQSENDSVIEGVVGQSENCGLEIESVDQSDNGSVVETVPIISQGANRISVNNESDSQEDELDSTSTNFADNPEDNNYKFPTSDQSDSSPRDNSNPEEYGQLIHKESVSPVLITSQPDGTVSPRLQVQDGNISQEKSLQEKSEDGNIFPAFPEEEVSKDGTLSDVQLHEMSEKGSPLSLQSQQQGQVGQDDQQSLNSVSSTQLEEYDSMNSFNQYTEQKNEDQVSPETDEGQSSDGNTQPDMTANLYITSETKDGDDDQAGDIEERRKEESKEVADESEEEDSSQFAQLIVQHVLGHAVSSFNESDTSLHDDTTDAGSQISLPTDVGVKPTIDNSVPQYHQATNIHGDIKATINGGTSPPMYQATGTEDRSLDQSGGQQITRSLADFQIDNSTYLEDSSGGSGLELLKRSNITLDSEMENETFDISMVSGESTQTDNPEGIVICGKGTQKYTVEDTMSDTDCCGPHSKLAPLAAYPEFPENYGNYKVCRTVGPNEKECLILETGENVTCKKNSKIPKTFSVRQTDKGNGKEFVSQPLNADQSSHSSHSSMLSDSSRNHKSFPEKGSVPVYTSIPREEEEVNKHPMFTEV
ncbi:dentin sialophosphoprotein-like [Pecten maximus]|uniref:dentin sialophosphoprotein-like n=1 Tax=Pecten maximus TaxID=6579 RepID=UPI001458F646|nr:dentin sialophosphoprotein-like [Pecten maximus]